MSKYVIINEDVIQKKIEEWEAEWRKCFEAPVGEFNHDYAIKLQQAIDTAREFLSQSTPLIPENIKPLQELVDEGYDPYDSAHHLQVQRMLKVIQEYISNLKLDI